MSTSTPHPPLSDPTPHPRRRPATTDRPPAADHPPVPSARPEAAGSPRRGRVVDPRRRRRARRHADRRHARGRRRERPVVRCPERRPGRDPHAVGRRPRARRRGHRAARVARSPARSRRPGRPRADRRGDRRRRGRGPRPHRRVDPGAARVPAGHARHGAVRPRDPRGVRGLPRRRTAHAARAPRRRRPLVASTWRFVRRGSGRARPAGAVTTGTTRRGPPRRRGALGRAAALVAAAIPTFYAVTRIAWVLGIPLGFSPDDVAQLAGDDGWVAALGLGGFALVGAVLTLGLFQRWGEVFPRWTVGLAGRRVPVALAVVPRRSSRSRCSPRGSRSSSSGSARAAWPSPRSRGAPSGRRSCGRCGRSPSAPRPTPTGSVAVARAGCAGAGSPARH